MVANLRKAQGLRVRFSRDEILALARNVRGAVVGPAAFIQQTMPGVIAGRQNQEA